MTVTSELNLVFCFRVCEILSLKNVSTRSRLANKGIL